MSRVILHHYPQSPVSEKVRVVLGMKGLDWQSVHIPRYPPKPDLLSLTGGYRRTPVMQIGANVYCDSQCIVRELDRRFSEPTLFPGGSAGLAWGLSRWTDGALFTLIIAAIFGEQGHELPEEFANDRGPLYFGPDYNVETLIQTLPETLAQIRVQFSWIDQRLADNRPFLLGERPGLPDALCYYLVWFLRGRVNAGPAMLQQFPKLEAWEQRVKALGHGQPADLSADQALDIARASQPEVTEWIDPADPLQVSAGQPMGVMPDEDGGDPTVRGRIARLTVDTIALRRHDDRVGEVIVHFPRVGYRIS
jgi:glutathione S-transferase